MHFAFIQCSKMQLRSGLHPVVRKKSRKFYALALWFTQNKKRGIEVDSNVQLKHSR